MQLQMGIGFLTQCLQIRPRGIDIAAAIGIVGVYLLVSLRMLIEEGIKEEQTEEIVLHKYKQWSFPFPLTSILSFDYFNIAHDDKVQEKNLRDSFKTGKN
mgnify:CR=1 FL=1